MDDPSSAPGGPAGADTLAGHADRAAGPGAASPPGGIPAVAMRSFDLARTGANTHETVLTPDAVRTRGLRRLHSLATPVDARGCEAQPLIVPGVTLADGRRRDVVLLATMANDVLAYDAADGTLLWRRTLGRPITGTKEIDWSGGAGMPLINDHWGILSTPVIDLADGILFVCCWISETGDWRTGEFFLAALRLRDGSDAHPPLSLDGAVYEPGHGIAPLLFRSAERKQRAALTLTAGAVLIPFGTVQETAETARGWMIAVDTASWTIAATWCSTARGHGGGIWASGGGPAVDRDGAIYVVTGNGGFDGVTDFAESIVKLRYTPPAAGRPGALAVTDWFTPWTDEGRTGGDPEGDEEGATWAAMPSNFRLIPHLAREGVAMATMNNGAYGDQDLGAGGAVLAPDGRTLLAAGKDGILYTADTTALGRTEPRHLAPADARNNYAKLRTPPIFYTYYPGIGPDAAPADVTALNFQWADRTHHLHGTPVVWTSAAHGTLHFCGGENGNLRAWSLAADGLSTYLACSAAVASPQSPVPPGGMPGWMISLSADGDRDGVVWALVPATDANMGLSAGRLLAYDAASFGRFADGSGEIVVLWDSWDWGEGCAFTHPKFNRPVAWGGRLFVPTYDGRVDVYGLAG